MSRLDDAIANARARTIDWNVERASNVLGAARSKRESHARRDRALRRGAIVVAGAALLVLVFFRSAAGQPEESSPAVAAIAMTDAGYQRD